MSLVGVAVLAIDSGRHDNGRRRPGRRATARGVGAAGDAGRSFRTRARRPAPSRLDRPGNDHDLGCDVRPDDPHQVHPGGRGSSIDAGRRGRVRSRSMRRSATASRAVPDTNSGRDDRPGPCFALELPDGARIKRLVAYGAGQLRARRHRPSGSTAATSSCHCSPARPPAPRRPITSFTTRVDGGRQLRAGQRRQPRRDRRSFRVPS